MCGDERGRGGWAGGGGGHRKRRNWGRIEEGGWFGLGLTTRHKHHVRSVWTRPLTAFSLQALQLTQNVDAPGYTVPYSTLQQHTATYGNTQQPTATHSNLLHPTATYSNLQQPAATYSNLQQPGHTCTLLGRLRAQQCSRAPPAHVHLVRIAQGQPCTRFALLQALCWAVGTFTPHTPNPACPGPCVPPPPPHTHTAQRKACPCTMCAAPTPPASWRACWTCPLETMRGQRCGAAWVARHASTDVWGHTPPSSLACQPASSEGVEGPPNKGVDMGGPCFFAPTLVISLPVAFVLPSVRKATSWRINPE
eukprot:195876-Chlamydomonas_euryale.AAC.2